MSFASSRQPEASREFDGLRERCDWMKPAGRMLIRVKRRDPCPSDLCLLFHRKRTGQYHWHVSFPNRWTDSLVDTIFNIFTFLAWPVVPSVVKFLGLGLLCFWHRLDQQRERLAEA
jgi:hypothetical protein